ncbi:MAG: T9SS type A sorting domain-containing protein [Hymenobacteraceae bacterium]|nr:T9SS type A sorting domain-containing protein [Hymenobacteraceae bacterium]MDX5481340.1 T9SS type A sorting domain-containing protein [Hymenobacteraceae bacterium]
MRIFTLLLFLCCSLGVFAQGSFAPPLMAGRTCGTDAYVEELKQRNPNFEQLQQQAVQAVQQAMQQQQQGQYMRQATISIPVVFHVVYNTQTENISEEQILSQLAILNADFRRKNEDAINTPSYFQPFAADTKIEFCLATIDPNGDPTDGITRTRTNRISFNYTQDDVKFSSEGGRDAWDSNKYLNIWICNIKDNVLGYATPPGTPAALDGVVVHFASVGAPPANRFQWNYNRGRTATHEVGHWLGLRHIWGSGSSCTDSDGIADTPNQFEENTGCKTGVQLSCDNGPYGDMYQNFMDYTDDACMNLFTAGQATYMQAVLSSTRGSLYSSLACSGTLRSDFSTALKGDTLLLAGKSVKYADASEGVRATSWFWEFEGGVPATSTEQNPVVTYPQPGKYGVKLTISNGFLSSTEVKENYVHVTVNDLVVYPNPASDFITIEQPARILVREVQLLNSYGQLVFTSEVRDRVLRVDVRHLPAGVYFLRLTSTNGTVVKKVSVVR